MNLNFDIWIYLLDYTLRYYEYYFIFEGHTEIGFPLEGFNNFLSSKSLQKIPDGIKSSKKFAFTLWKDAEGF